jgi:flagellar protein FlgJ
MDARISRPVLPATDVYTDVQGLQNLKAEDNQDLALKKIAQQFESLFLHEMLKTMRKANEAFEEGSLFNGKDTQFFRDMYDQQLSLSLAQKGTGLAQVIYEQLSRQYVNNAEEVDASSQTFAVPQRKASPVMHSPVMQQSSVRNAAEDTALEPVQSAIMNEQKASGGFTNAREFIDAVLPHARAAASALGLNPLFLTAQAALETGWGKYVIRDGSGESTHNLFNIKADRAWQGDKAEVSTLEYRGGVPVREQAQFRKYGDVAESFADYVQFLQDNPRYQDALAVAANDRDFAFGLQNAGYATDPAYADKILAIVQRLSADTSVTGASF